MLLSIFVPDAADHDHPLLFEPTLEVVKEMKEGFAERRENMQAQLHYRRCGDLETEFLDLVLIPNVDPYPTPERVAMAANMIAIPSFGFHYVAFISDTFGLWGKGGPAEAAAITKRIQDEWGGSLQAAVDAGRKDELDIREAVCVVYAKRTECGCSLSVATLPYDETDGSVKWREDEFQITHEAQHPDLSSNFADALREAFAKSIQLETETKAMMEHFAEHFSGMSAMGVRFHQDMAGMRMLTENISGGMVPSIPPGPRADKWAERLSDLAQYHEGVFGKLSDEQASGEQGETR